jgi:hypothetical protein
VARVARGVVARAEAAERARRPFTITVDAAEGATYPWAWYFRHLDAAYVDLASGGTPARNSDVLILTVGARDRFGDQLRGYDVRRFPFRVWWVREYSRMSPAAWWRYLTEREPWNATGGMPEWLYERR